MESIDLPSFEEASERMRDFLSQHNLLCEIVWVTKQEACFYRQVSYVKHDAVKSEAQSKVMYEHARQKGLGVRISAWRTLDSAIACTVWYQRDELQAKYALQSCGLKMTIHTPLRPAVRIRSSLVWILLKCLSRLMVEKRMRDWHFQ